jgi:hypothetical protein
MGGTHDSSVKLGTNPRVLRAKGVYNASQAEIHTRREERRADGEANDLGHEAGVEPLVLPAHDAASVADDLAQDAQAHGDGEAQTPAGDGPGSREAEERQREDGEEEGVGGQPDTVLIVAVDVLTGHVEGICGAEVPPLAEGPGFIAWRYGRHFGRSGRRIGPLGKGFRFGDGMRGESIANSRGGWAWI